jgi:hypothetical protein
MPDDDVFVRALTAVRKVTDPLTAVVRDIAAQGPYFDWMALNTRLGVKGMLGAALTLVIDRSVAGYYLKASLRSVDVFTGEPTSVCGRHFLPNYINTEEEALSYIRRVLADLLLHELDESLWLDGRQITNPHPF